MLIPGENTIAQWDAIRRVMEKIDVEVFERLGRCVITGPFKGMVVADRYNWNDGNAITKLLGNYERELWDAIALVVRRQPRAVINVGCAEGYYAIGLKLTMPDVPVIACDLSAASLEICNDLARRNGVKIRTHLGCKTPEAMRFGYTDALYVMDCEGDEYDLLDPLRCTDLYSADVIVECHDWIGPISNELALRFRPTHEVGVVDLRLEDFPAYQDILSFLPIGKRLAAIAQKRPSSIRWLVLLSKQRRL